MSIQKRRKFLPPLVGGVNDASNLLSLRTNEAHSIINMHLDPSGVARTRMGSRLLSTLDDPITALFDYHRLVEGESVGELLAVAGYKLYTIDYTTGVETELTTLSTNVRPSMVVFNDGSGNMNVIIANGVDFIMYDGNSVSEVTASFPGSSAPRYLLSYDNRLFAAGCPTDPYVVWVSGIEDASSWDVNDYFSKGNVGGDSYVGLGVVGKYAVLFKRFQIEFVTEGDPQSTTVQHLVASSQYGLSSHWSYITAGGVGYFLDESGIYSISAGNYENTLIVQQIHKKVENAFKELTNLDLVTSTYDPNNNEILFGVQDSSADDFNKSLILNLHLTKFDNYGNIYPIWGGHFEGDAYVPCVLGSFVNPDGKVIILRANGSGNLYVMDESTQYKDDSTDIISKIYTGAVAPLGLSARCNFRSVTPSIWNQNDGSVNVAWVTDASYHGGDIQFVNWNSTLVSLTGNVPVWNEGTQDEYLQVWGSTIWANNAIIPTTLDINKLGRYIEFMIWCEGANDDDKFEYSGLELTFQVKGIK